MFTVEAIRAWANDLVVQVTETNKEAGQRAMVAKAVLERNRVLGGTPRPSGYRQYVNNVADAALETVTYDGVIVFAWQYLQDLSTKFVVQVPLHNVELVVRMLASKYQDVAYINYNYVDVEPAYVLKGHFNSRRRQPRETHTRYPAIIIRPRFGA